MLVLVDKLHRQRKNTESHIALVAGLEYETDAEREAELLRLARRRDELTAKIDSIRARVAECATCCICYDTIQNKTISPCCSNAYCFRCINMWLHRSGSCALCKEPLQAAQLLVVQTDDAPPRQAERDKIGAMEDILRARCAAAPGAARVMVFSSYENTFVGVTGALDRLGLRYRTLKGNHAVVRRIVDAFTSGEIDVLLVNTHNYGNGLNFEVTTDVIMFHKLDTEIEGQVVGRAQRCGRTCPLKIWYLLYANEMDRARPA